MYRGFSFMYDYPAEILDIVDGDTIDIFADKGTDDFKKMRIRFNKINAPEKNTPEGVAAKQWLTELLTNDDGTFKHLYVFTVKDKKEKYGRYLGEIWIWGEDFTKVKSINDRLVEAGHAAYKTY
jgi:endonuclease YncB( thermonuclease family)